MREDYLYCRYLLYLIVVNSLTKRYEIDIVSLDSHQNLKKIMLKYAINIIMIFKKVELT